MHSLKRVRIANSCARGKHVTILLEKMGCSAGTLDNDGFQDNYYCWRIYEELSSSHYLD